MPNVAGVLREEICRLAKKEIRTQIGKTQRAAAQYRRDIAKLKRLLSQQEKEIRLLKKRTVQQGRPQSDDGKEMEGIRFSARSVRAQRQRLGLSAADYGKLVGVSGLTIYNWEHEKARPRKRSSSPWSPSATSASEKPWRSWRKSRQRRSSAEEGEARIKLLGCYQCLQEG